MLKNVIQNTVIINVVYVKVIHNLSFLEMKFAMNNVIFSFQLTHENCSENAITILRKIFKLAKNKIDNNTFIFSDKAILSKCAILISERDEQYVSQIIVATLVIDEQSIENSSLNILKLIKSL